MRCVIAAGWAVDDGAAKRFATSFYEALLRRPALHRRGRRGARERARTGGNTWAAYQCYGDPDWRFRTQTGDAAEAPAPTCWPGIRRHRVSPALIVTLERIAVESEYQGKKPKAQATRLRYLEQKFAQYWEGRGNVAEAFGKAWLKSRGFEEAIDWYQRAGSAQDGTASFASIEQLANAKIRLAWERAISQQPRSTRRETDIKDAMKLLDKLIALAPTVERESLYGSGYKRLALLEARPRGWPTSRTQRRRPRPLNRPQSTQMWTHYKSRRDARPRKTCRAGAAAVLSCDEPNRRTARARRRPRRRTAMDHEAIALVRSSMRSVPPDFWSVIGQTELDMYVSIAAGTLARDADRLIEDSAITMARVGNAELWSSVFDNATFVLSKYRTRAEANRSGCRGSAPRPAQPRWRVSGRRGRVPGDRVGAEKEVGDPPGGREVPGKT